MDFPRGSPGETGRELRGPTRRHPRAADLSLIGDPTVDNPLPSPGSSDDLGRVKQGILEPAPEYVLFTMPVNAVGGPVETPRGFWIVKRLE